jgi:ABC-type uncharacterized transport system substrate-binding protein
LDTLAPSVLAAKAATTTIPIAVGVSRDPVELGTVSNLARPGGNVTGMELRDSEISKRLELLKQIRFTHSTQCFGESRQSNPMSDESKIRNRKSKVVRAISPNVLARADKVIR